MRRVVLVFMSTVTTLVLLFGYHTSTNNTSLSSSPMVQTPAATDPAPSLRASGGGGSSSTKSGTGTTSSPVVAAVSYTGGVADTQWGPIQVRITVRGGKITRARTVQYPQGSITDAQINNYALPILDQEVVQKQSASIDAVSGATVTSGGYLQSLQSAIDQAHL